MDRPSFHEAVVILADRLSGPNVKSEIRALVMKLFDEKAIKLVQITLDERAAPVLKDSRLLKASDAFLELLSALGALDWDKVVRIDHEVRLPNRAG